MTEKKKKNLFSLFIMIVSLSAFVLALLVLVCYAAGALREFTDDVQLFFLRLLAFLGFFLVLVSLCGMIHNGYRLAREGGFRFLPGMGGYLVLGILGIFLAVLASFVLVISGGNA
ncbi:MAG: hypothetical protein LBI86_05450 [Treponema sp.]|jgi:hypothetical protein|nr:hypothetical protein [Treponema sp.]